MGERRVMVEMTSQGPHSRNTQHKSGIPRRSVHPLGAAQSSSLPRNTTLPWFKTIGEKNWLGKVLDVYGGRFLAGKEETGLSGGKEYSPPWFKISSPFSFSYLLLHSSSAYWLFSHCFSLTSLTCFLLNSLFPSFFCKRLFLSRIFTAH